MNTRKNCLIHKIKKKQNKTISYRGDSGPNTLESVYLSYTVCKYTYNMSSKSC